VNQPGSRPPNRRRRWLVTLAILTVGAIALAQFVARDGGRRHVTGKRVAPYLPSAAEVAAAAGVPASLMRQIPPPVNPEEVEIAARSLTLGQAPLPDDRIVVTYQRGDTNGETTIALLLYDDPAAAAEVAQSATTLLPRGLGLEPVAGQIADAEEAQRWSGEGYDAWSFRRGGVVGFLASSEPESGAWLGQLAAGMLQAVTAHPPATTTAQPH
jgi:hypothetical protein